MAKVNPDNIEAYEKYRRSKIIKDRDKENTTYKQYQSAMNIWFSFLLTHWNNVYILDPEFLEDDIIECIEDFIYFCQEDLSNGKKSINFKLSAISSFYIYAVSRKMNKINHHPFAGVLERMANAKDEKLISEHFMTEEEINKIYTELDKVIEPDYHGPFDRLDRTLWYIAYVSANRIGALSLLTVSSFDRNVKAFKGIREKSGGLVEVGVLEKEVAVIDDYLAHREELGVDCDAFFHTFYDGEWRGMSIGSLSKRINKIGELILGFPIRPHEIRKARANMIANNYGIEYAQSLLNHASSSTTQAHYVRKKDASDTLAKIAEMEALSKLDS